ncbi:cell division protein ZapE [Insolitispirillum peregrinum]|uniref:cell division protein ZapE n=1 Tax=Insolitispirillum peregrinum TaxID=80876 RepID=UPI003617FBBC
MPHHGPLTLYRAKVQRGELKPDPAQQLAAEKFESLYHALRTYQPATGPTGWKARFGLARRVEEPTPPQGLYIYGDVGRGKSMLMDLFFSTAPVKAKRRIHFHEFMRDFHAEMHRWRQGKSKDDADPIPPLAKKIAAEAWLLCLDELEIHDITDAMIVGRIFDQLFKAGVVVVTTSNRHPDDLYKNGLQRDRFLPFIALIKERLDLLHLASDTDYRLGRLKGAPVYHHPLTEQTATAIDALFGRLAADTVPSPAVMQVNGREVPVPLAAGDVARFGFADLCAKPLGPTDYLQIATLYDSVVITDVPLLGPHNRDQARRFVTLIDALYDHRTMVVISAEAAPEVLYPVGDGAFEFQRTVSRLMEMQSEEYLRAKHLT